MLDSFWPLVDDKEEDKDMAAHVLLRCSWGPQYQPTIAELSGTRDELCELMGLAPGSSVGALTQKWSELHAYNVENLSPGKG